MQVLFCLRGGEWSLMDGSNDLYHCSIKAVRQETKTLFAWLFCFEFLPQWLVQVFNDFIQPNDFFLGKGLQKEVPYMVLLLCSILNTHKFGDGQIVHFLIRENMKISRTSDISPSKLGKLKTLSRVFYLVFKMDLCHCSKHILQHLILHLWFSHSSIK